ncbi:MAG: hypothetical protein GQ535_11355 [Rhodobacteraceae bacterium]|nr:hypothetical protein [Paracoccaceae bacterium]
MSVLRFFSAAKVWSHGDFYEPWEAGPSIFEFLADTPNEGSEQHLPDEEKLFKPDKIRFAAGALDNLLGGASEDSLKKAAKHYGMIQKVVS